MRHREGFDITPASEGSVPAAGEQICEAGTVLNTVSCTVLASLQKENPLCFSPGAHNEQVHANSSSSTGEGRVRGIELLFPSSVSEKLYLFMQIHEILGEAFSGV